jgi:signal peptidase I
MKKFLIFVWELVKVVAISAAIILPIRFFLIQPFIVKGESMEPNFYDKEYLIIDEISYRFQAPERGQVVVFRYPRNPQEYFIKRIIGLPGETIDIKDGQVVVYNADKPEGFILDESYLPNDLATYSENEGRVTVGADEYFVLGDNRGASKDSRYFGPVDKSFVTGKVLLRGWPFSRFAVFGREDWPKYQ